MPAPQEKGVAAQKGSGASTKGQHHKGEAQQHKGKAQQHKGKAEVAQAKGYKGKAQQHKGKAEAAQEPAPDEQPKKRTRGERKGGWGGWTTVRAYLGNHPRSMIPLRAFLHDYPKTHGKGGETYPIGGYPILSDSAERTRVIEHYRYLA